MDYGYLEGTSAGDGGGIDVWLGSMGLRRVTGIICTVDGKKRDAEIKILLDCTEEENRLILDFLNRGSIRAMLIERGDGFARVVLPERPVR
ncbi:MAG: hypothetical protein ACUVRM_06335 [Bacillota bacterium]